MKVRFLLFFSCLFLMSLSTAWGQLVKIGTGGVSGIYYPVGGLLSLLFNEQIKNDAQKKYTIFLPKISAGTKQNLQDLLSNEVQFALAQSNVAAEAYQRGVAENKKERQLRTVFSLYPEYVTIVARKDIAIHSFGDLQGKRVAVGTTNSGSLQDVQHILSVFSLSLQDFSEVYHSAPNNAVTALCYGNIDAVVLTVGHPSSSVFRMLGKCQGQLIPFSRSEIKMVTEKYPAYSDMIIPNDTYQKQVEVRTLGMYSLFMTRADQPEELVYQLTKRTFERLDKLKRGLPVLSHLKKKLMAMQHANIPIHSGAKKYFSERGFYD